MTEGFSNRAIEWLVICRDSCISWLALEAGKAKTGMAASDLVLWAVDTQADFMLPGGKLYVPGAEKLLPNIQRLTDTARAGRVFMVSHGCYHPEDDPEFQLFPPHCIQGTPGSEFVSHALTEKLVRIPNDPAYAIPQDLSFYQQVLIEKQTLDVFESRHADRLLQQMPRPAEFLVFGVVTEYCVRFAAKGLLERERRVAVVEDAIETLDSEQGRRTIAELKALGAKVITTQQALQRIHVA
jgi:nicotinamidase/pyrazinamidase